MFEDLSRLIDHHIYLATQACLQGVLGNGSTSHANLESGAVHLPAAAAAAAPTNGRRLPILSTSLSLVTPSGNTDSSRALAAAQRDHDQTQRHDGQEWGRASEKLGLEGIRAAPLATSSLASPQDVEGRGGLAASFETLRLGNYYDKARGVAIGRSRGEVGENSRRTSIGGDESRHDLNRSVSSLRRRTTPEAPTKYTGLEALMPLKPLPQPVLASRAAEATRLHVGRSPRVVQIPRPSPRRSNASALAHAPGSGALRDNAAAESGSNAENNAIPSTKTGRLPPDGSLGPEHIGSTAKQPPPPTRLTHEQFSRPAAEHSIQGQQQQQASRRDNADEKEEKDVFDSSPLLNITTITLLVEDLPPLKHFYERVFAVAPTHEDTVSVTFPFNKGRLRVTLMSHRQGAQPLLARHRDVGMSVTVEDMEGVWQRLRMLNEGKGKGREEDGPADDGLRFEGLAASGWEEPEVQGKRIVFCDPAGYCWEVTEEDYYT